MNITNLLAGDIVGTIGSKAIESIVNKLMPSKSSKFSELMEENPDAEKISVEDLNLSNEERIALEEMRQLALNKGIDSVEIEIGGRKYQMSTEDSSLIPMYATASH